MEGKSQTYLFLNYRWSDMVPRDNPPQDNLPKTMCPEAIRPGDDVPRRQYAPGDNVPRKTKKTRLVNLYVMLGWGLG